MLNDNLLLGNFAYVSRELAGNFAYIIVIQIEMMLDSTNIV